MQLRRASRDDAALLARLNRHVHALHAAAEPGLYRQPSDEEVVSWFSGRLGGDAEAIVAEQDGAAIGYVVFRVVARPASVFSHARRWLEVDELGVVPGAQRAGCGRALMEAVHGRAAELGIDRVELSVRAFNHEAIAFYRAIGFAPAGLRMARTY